MDTNFQNLQNVVSPQQRHYFRKKLLGWYYSNRRSFPWRKTKNAYKVLVAEILLQQTDAIKVAKEYPSFIRLFPNSDKLSKASKQTIQKFISKLGLDYRVKRLIDTARCIENNFGGEVPDTEEDLLRLPGVGRYMANAVLACAYSRRVAVLDTNVVRLITRFFGLKSTKARPRNDAVFWLAAKRLLPQKTDMCREWHYALLDFGALVCCHYNPKCEQCPCRRKCSYFGTLKA